MIDCEMWKKNDKFMWKMTCNQLHKIIVTKIVAFYMILELLFWELQEAIFLCLAELYNTVHTMD